PVAAMTLTAPGSERESRRRQKLRRRNADLLPNQGERPEALRLSGRLADAHLAPLALSLRHGEDRLARLGHPVLEERLQRLLRETRLLLLIRFGERDVAESLEVFGVPLLVERQRLIERRV